MRRPSDSLRRSALTVCSTAAAAALLTSCAAGPSAQAPTTAAPVVSVVAVRRGDLTRTRELSGEFHPYEEIDVHAKVAGYVREIRVDVGDRVTAGELLATLEIPELQAEVAQADAAVKETESEITRARADLTRAQSAQDVTHKTATRLTAVAAAQPGLVAQQEIDEAVGKDRVADAQVNTAQAAVAAAEEQAQVAQANATRLHAMFEYSHITAPFAGVVTKRYADTGSMIQAGTASETQAEPLVRLSRIAKLRLVIPVPESSVPDIHLGAPVAVTVPVLNRTFPGTVARFSDQVDMSTRMMHTEVDVENPTGELVPGVYATASFVISQRHGVLAVPIEAIIRGDKVSVFVVNAKHQIELCDVTLGLETSDAVEVLSGLAEGDQVVVSNHSQLRPGLVVEAHQAAPAAQGGR